ncbi:damage-control phosphatase ARMT1 family protein [Clostridium ganghwense]|uniref:ARMT1-like domain-containing protein n=1 Tax=Clostridium ganghwense TaxID=312089 RepID=A0ABT4CUD7_9CLOT|nr:ARMT1-like domain-containing protein [Clostridium ganghwense]MCY6372637.1 ARMT1-like domain-containing protein [Clostridium ganghwense]
MKLDLNCITCNINQAIKIMDLLEMERNKKEEMMREVLEYLSNADYSKCNPEVIGGTWNIILKYIENDNPYSDIKKYYNIEVLKMIEEIENLIRNSDNKFNTALKIAIAGNLIDFAAKHKFDLDMLKKKIMNIQELNLTIDHSKNLYESLKIAKSVMYLGDNCGEICLDKLFIKYIKNEFPNVKVYFGVRGKIIVNDVTFDDAQMVGMQEVADTIENGDGSLGTVIERVSDEFREKFYGADVVIAKGQGNYESLSEIDKKNIFHLFMAKCEPVSSSLGVKTMSIVCVENKKLDLSIAQ